VNVDDLESAPSSNLTTSLAGRAGGMIAYQRSGEPGENSAEFFIRGVSTFGYEQDPLIRIDGVEATNRDLARLRPEDIANFSILKDATATSLYGSRAANGVILIQTKEGYDSDGDARISLRLENSVSSPTDRVQLASPVEYMKLNNEAVTTRNPLAARPFSQRKIEETAAGGNSFQYPAVDWRDELFSDYATSQRAFLSVRGGGDIAQYYVSGSVNQDNGLLKVPALNNFNNNISLKNYSLRSNVNINLTNTTQLDVRLNGSFDDYVGPIPDGDYLYLRAMQASPVRFPATYPSEARSFAQNPLFGNFEDEDGDYMLNPYADMVEGYEERSRSVMDAQMSAKQDLSSVAQGLRASLMFNTRRNSFFSLTRSYDPYWYSASATSGDSLRLDQLNPEGGQNTLGYNPQEKRVSTNFYLESKVNYDSTFSDRHTLGGLAVVTARHAVTGNENTLQASLPRRNLNMAARASYSYDDRYYIELNGAYNGSERFAEDFRFGFFPSVGVAWRISEENFFEPVESVVNNLRLRATYGLSGNDQIASRNNRFLYLSEVDLQNDAYGAQFGTQFDFDRPGVLLQRYSNPLITWERSQKLNLALDVGLFDRLEFTAEFFREYRSNILQARENTTPSLGLEATTRANLGAAINRGVDASMTYNQSFGSKAWLQARGNFTFARSEYVEYEELAYENAPWKSRIGNPINQQYGYIAERLFVDDEEAENSPPQFGEYGGGDIKYRDVNDDGKITPLDRVPIGYPTQPEIVYGFGFSGGYGNFDLSAFFQGQARNSFWLDSRYTAPFLDPPGDGIDGKAQILEAYADDHWSENDRDVRALWPRLSASGTAGTENNTKRSTWFMRNGAFLRVKQVEIGYNLPQSLLDWARIAEARIYANASNLYSFSSFDLWDVEMAGNGLRYPLQRTVNVGIDMTF
jgi:TonB-linked SusC/RagA family outer membrane protein